MNVGYVRCRVRRQRHHMLPVAVPSGWSRIELHMQGVSVQTVNTNM